MKKMILWKLLFFILIYNSNVLAQKFRFGFVGGLDIANARLTNKPDIEFETKVFYPMISLNANGYIGFKSAGFWGISVEPGYIQKGGVVRNVNNDNIRIQLNYLHLPVFADFYFGEKFFLSAGPEFAYLINAKAKSMGNSNDISDAYDNDFEVSGTLGINYNFHKHFDIGLKYSHGLTYTTKITWTDETGTFLDESKEYNQYFQVFVRFKI